MLFDPNFTIWSLFLLPDRRDLLELIDAPAAGGERIGAMLGAHDDQHDVLADLNRAGPMEDERLDDVEVLQRPLADLPELLLRHAFVVLERDGVHVMALRAVARGAEEHRDAADPLAARLDARELGIEREVAALHADELIGRMSLARSAAGERREQRDLIAFLDLRVLMG